MGMDFFSPSPGRVMRIIGAGGSNCSQVVGHEGFRVFFHTFGRRPSHPKVLESKGQLYIFLFDFDTRKFQVPAKCQQHLKHTGLIAKLVFTPVTGMTLWWP